jgi:hypothetical protein
MEDAIFYDDDGMESMQNSLLPVTHCAFQATWEQRNETTTRNFATDTVSTK